MDVMPKWVDVVVVPMFSLVLAALLSAMLILATVSYTHLRAHET